MKLEEVIIFLEGYSKAKYRMKRIEAQIQEIQTSYMMPKGIAYGNDLASSGGSGGSRSLPHNLYAKIYDMEDEMRYQYFFNIEYMAYINNLISKVAMASEREALLITKKYINCISNIKLEEELCYSGSMIKKLINQTHKRCQEILKNEELSEVMKRLNDAAKISVINFKNEA